MKYFLLIVSLAFGSSNAWSSDHDGTPSQLAVIWECTLNEGITARDVAEWGSTDFKKFTEKNSLNMTSYLWEAISVNPPFDAPDVRWVDYLCGSKDGLRGRGDCLGGCESRPRKVFSQVRRLSSQPRRQSSVWSGRLSRFLVRSQVQLLT